MTWVEEQVAEVHFGKGVLARGGEMVGWCSRGLISQRHPRAVDVW